MAATDLEWDDDAVANPDITDGITDRDDFGDAFMTDGMPGRHRQNTSGYTNVEVAARHGNRDASSQDARET